MSDTDNPGVNLGEFVGAGTRPPGAFLDPGSMQIRARRSITRVPTGAALEGYAGLGSLGDVFGKPQSWYDTVTRLQNDLSVVLAEINAVGKDPWDAASGAIVKAGAIPSWLTSRNVKYFPGFDWATGEVIDRINAVMPSQKYLPSDGDLALGRQRVQEFHTMVEYLKTLAPPAAAAKIDQDAAYTRAKVEAITPYKSPLEAGEAEFWKELKRRSDLFGAAGLQGVWVLGIVGALLAGWFIWNVTRR